MSDDITETTAVPARDAPAGWWPTSCADLEPDSATGARMSASVFYLVYDCPACGDDIHHGPCVSTLEYRDRPVIPADLGAMLTLTCPHCQADVHVGELELFNNDDGL